MSSSLYWRPVKPIKRHGGYGHPLKGIIAKKFYGHDGSLSGGDITLDETHIKWLEGVKDALYDCVDDANELIDGIRQYGEIAIWIES